jgi:hypothetical protein
LGFFTFYFFGSLRYLGGIRIGSPPCRAAVQHQRLIGRLTLTTPFGTQGPHGWSPFGVHLEAVASIASLPSEFYAGCLATFGGMEIASEGLWVECWGLELGRGKPPEVAKGSYSFVE